MAPVDFSRINKECYFYYTQATARLLKSSQTVSTSAATCLYCLLKTVCAQRSVRLHSFVLNPRGVALVGGVLVSESPPPPPSLLGILWDLSGGRRMAFGDRGLNGPWVVPPVKSPHDHLPLYDCRPR